MNHAMMILLGLLVVCFLIRMPIAIRIIIPSTLYLAVKDVDPNVVVEIFTSKMYNNLILLTAPFFIFTASIVNSNKVIDKTFDFSKALVGWWRGGLGHMNVIVSLIFPGTAGSTVTDTSGPGITEIKAIHKEGYDDDFNAAITAGSAVVSLVFPPSIPLVIYGVIAGASIGNLFPAGIVPEAILALALCVYVCYIANKRNYPSGKKYAGMEFIRITVSAIPTPLTPIILLMGIYTGIMIATEARVVTALYTPLISIFAYRSMTLPEFMQVLKNTVKSTGQISIMLGAACVFSYVVAVENLPSLTGNPILSFATTKITFLIFVNTILFTLGMLLDSAALQLVLFPILCPIVQSLGIDMVHFGVVLTLNTITGLCTPPFGMLLFIVTGISGEKVSTIIKGVIPMVLVMVLVLILVTFVPGVIV